MINRIINNIIKNSSIPITDEYINSLYRRLQVQLDYINLPVRYLTEYIDTSNPPKELTRLGNNIQNIIDGHKNVLINLLSFKESGFIASSMIEFYLWTSMCAENHINSILYVDTNLLLEDYKKLMTNGDTIPRLSHNKDLLFNYIYDADFVFWDKFNFVETNYEASKIYEILSVRYRDCLGNMFFCAGDTLEERLKNIGRDILDVMDCHNENIYDFTMEKYTHLRMELSDNG